MSRSNHLTSLRADDPRRLSSNGRRRAGPSVPLSSHHNRDNRSSLFHCNQRLRTVFCLCSGINRHLRRLHLEPHRPNLPSRTEQQSRCYETHLVPRLRQEPHLARTFRLNNHLPLPRPRLHHSFQLARRLCRPRTQQPHLRCPETDPSPHRQVMSRQLCLRTRLPVFQFVRGHRPSTKPIRFHLGCPRATRRSQFPLALELTYPYEHQQSRHHPHNASGTSPRGTSLLRFLCVVQWPQRRISRRRHHCALLLERLQHSDRRQSRQRRWTQMTRRKTSPRP
jgi:hypothetical protein